MTFKDVKQGYQVFILHKGDKVSYSIGKVIAVSNPRFQTPSQPVANPFSVTSTQVVDVTIDDDGQQKTYTIPENLDVTFAGQDMVISTTRDGIVREVEAIKGKAESEMAKMERYKSNIVDCDKVLMDMNPDIKAKKENDARLGCLESDVKDMKTMIKNLLDKLT